MISIGEMIMIVKMICAGGRNQRNRLKIRARDTEVCTSEIPNLGEEECEAWTMRTQEKRQ